VDGCGPFRFFISIVIPLSTPVLTTIAVLTLVDSWNNFLLPLLVLDNDRLYTLPLGVMQFAGQYLYQWQDVLAFLAMAMVPAVIFYIFAQKYLIAGLTGGSIKQ
jgi:raffinose/stachyose/melibiose transport system permease protein